MDESPYMPPKSNLVTDDGALLHRGRRTARMGVVLFTGPIWGILGTIVGMLRAFDTLTEDGATSAQELAQSISAAMIATAIGIVVGVIGGILILVALLGAKNREKWFFRWSVSLAVIWCLMIFPYGLIIGLPVGIIFFTKREEFVTPN